VETDFIGFELVTSKTLVAFDWFLN